MFPPHRPTCSCALACNLTGPSHSPNICKSMHKSSASKSKAPRRRKYFDHQKCFGKSSKPNSFLFKKTNKPCTLQFCLDKARSL